MYTEVYRSHFQVMFYDDVARLLRTEWMETSEEMTSAIYKEEIYEFISVTENFKPTKFLCNTEKMNFIIEPELQTWCNEQLDKIVVTNASGVYRKLAIIISQDIFSMVSIEQLLEEIECNPNLRILSKTFDSEQKAKKWLLSDSEVEVWDKL